MTDNFDVRDDSLMFDEADYRDEWDDVEFLTELNDMELPDVELDLNFDSWDDIPV